MFRLAGREEEIDIAYVKGVPTEEAALCDERPGDISVYTYGEPWNEDYTHKSIVKTKDVQEVFEISELP